MNLADASLTLVYGAMAAYTVAMIAFGIDLAGYRGRAGRIGMSVTWAAFALHLAGTVLRGIAAGRVPWANMYEFTLTFTCVAVAVFLILTRTRPLEALGVFVTFAALVSLGIAVAVLYVKVAGTPPILDSYWLVIHVVTAVIATGLFTFAALLAFFQLATSRKNKRRSAPKRAEEPVGVAADTDRRIAERLTHEETAAGPETVSVAPAGRFSRLITALPDPKTLEENSFRITVIGFILWTFTLIAGAVWAAHAWGRAWNWDPKETMSLVVWFVYAAYLHARSTRGWSGRRAAWLCLLGFVVLMLNYYAVNFLADSRHAYTGL
ncbi:MAG: c-type cytochrome biogenesis protein CcsB [Flaviflexus sp.]|nr:c-type cytochrome biogenesis protein CcsB [Flaviflexus sp.]